MGRPMAANYGYKQENQRTLLDKKTEGKTLAKPKIGLSMLYCLGDPFKKMIAQLSKAQVSHIEIVDDGFHTLNKKRTLLLKDIGESQGLQYSVHAPFADINIASPSKPIYNAMLKRLKTSIDNANALDAYMWIFHPGLRTGVSMFYPNMDWKQNLKTAQTLFKIAEDCGVKAAIENVPEPFPFLMKGIEDFTKFYKETSENIDLVLDVGHANLNGQMKDFLKVFADKIVHIHAHDNNGKDDQHLGIGYGTVEWENFAALLKKIAYDKVVVIESVERIEESTRKLKQLFA
jgi:sugar phosphate isomerase/epimerase